MTDHVILGVFFLAVIEFGVYTIVDATLDSPPVVYRTAAVHEVAAVPNKKQEAACADLAAAPGGTIYGPIRPVAGILELARDKLNLVVAVPGQDLPRLVHGIPDRHTQVGDDIHICGAVAGETFLWPLVGYTERSFSFFGGQRGGPEYGPPAATRYRRVLWVADLGANP